MSERPTKKTDWATTGAIIEPSGAKKASGWLGAEKPPHEYMNWIQNLAYQWQDYLDSLQQGVAASPSFGAFNAYDFPAAVQTGLRFSEGTNPGEITVSAGVAVSSDGVRVEYTTDQVDFNSVSPATPWGGPGPARLDTVYVTLDPTTKAPTLVYEQGDAGTGAPPTPPAGAIVLGVIVVDDNATYTVRFFYYSGRSKEPAGRIVVSMGDGGNNDIFSFNQGSSLQLAILLMNQAGGGVVELSSDIAGDVSMTGGSITLLSNVVVEGNNRLSINQSVDTKGSRLFRCVGLNTTAGTLDAAGNLTTAAAIDFTFFGIGSLVTISGTEYLIRKINGAQDCDLGDKFYRPVVTTPGAVNFEVDINKAGLRNLTLRANGDWDNTDPEQEIAFFENTRECYIENCVFDYDYTGGGTAASRAMLVSGNLNGFRCNYNETRGDFSNALLINPNTGDDADNVRIMFNRFGTNHNVQVDDDTGAVTFDDFSYHGNLVPGLEVIDPGMVFWVNPHVYVVGTSTVAQMLGNTSAGLTVGNLAASGDNATTKYVDDEVLTTGFDDGLGDAATWSVRGAPATVDTIADIIAYLKHNDGATNFYGIRQDKEGNVIIGKRNMGVADTFGDFFLPDTNVGKPTGIPRDLSAKGFAAVRFDRTNHVLWVYDTASAAWRGLRLESSGFVETATINSLAVTTAKIAAGAVDETKVSGAVARWEAGAFIDEGAVFGSRILGTGPYRVGNVNEVASFTASPIEFELIKTGPTGVWEVQPTTKIVEDYVITAQLSSDPLIVGGSIHMNHATTKWVIRTYDSAGALAWGDWSFYALRVT